MAGDLKPGTELNLIRQAIRNKWNIPDDAKEKLASTMLSMVDDKKVAKRDQINAAKVIVQMNDQNLKVEFLEDKNARLDTGKSTENNEVKVTIKYENSPE